MSGEQRAVKGQYEVAMTLVVEAESEMEAHSLAERFEKERQAFEPPYEWLHVGLTPNLYEYERQVREEEGVSLAAASR